VSEDAFHLLHVLSADVETLASQLGCLNKYPYSAYSNLALLCITIPKNLSVVCLIAMGVMLQAKSLH